MPHFLGLEPLNTLTSGLHIFPIRQLGLGKLVGLQHCKIPGGAIHQTSCATGTPRELCSVQPMRLYRAALGTLKDDGERSFLSMSPGPQTCLISLSTRTHMTLHRGLKAEAGLGGHSCPCPDKSQPVWVLGCQPITWSSSLPQSWSFLPATELCHFVSLALALLVLWEALAQVDTKKMVRTRCAVHPRACYPICFLLLPALPVGHCLQSPQVGTGCLLSQSLRLLSLGFQFPWGGRIGGEWGAVGDSKCS